jgi:hypothetical protein
VARVQPTVLTEHIYEHTADLGGSNRQPSWAAIEVQKRSESGALFAVEQAARPVAEYR